MAIAGVEIYELDNTATLIKPDKTRQNLGRLTNVSKWQLLEICKGINSKRACIGIRQGPRTRYFGQTEYAGRGAVYWQYITANEALKRTKIEREQQLILGLSNVK